MKDVVIAFLLALVIGSAVNGWYATQQANAPLSNQPPPPTDLGGAKANVDPDFEQTKPSVLTQPAANRASAVHIPNLDEPGFDRDVIKSASPVLVFFTSPGSDACQKMLPVVQNVAEKVQAEVRVVQVDVMSNPVLSEEYGAQRVPTFAVFKDGKEVDTAAGELDSNSLLAFLKKTVPNAGNG